MSNAKRHAKITELFLAASELPQEEINDFLAHECGEDAALRSEVEDMLSMDKRNSSFLEQPVLHRDEEDRDHAKADIHLGPDSDLSDIQFDSKQLPKIEGYQILGVLGQGGMGIVYLAEQSKPIHRRVALKIIKLGMDTRQVVARFETEREALALMNHPNVAQVFDAGATEQGRPYFVMEHVAGIPITDYCDKHRLTTEERLRLFLDVCSAVQHAHQKGIIHRDIKPSNVLVFLQDGMPTPKVIDFGVAKATQHRLTERTIFTEQGQLIGTPGYMSPEQAEMTGLDIDTRTDIYSLGVLLYELLVGALPFENKALFAGGLAEIQRVIREVDPPKPSTKLSNLGEASTAIAHHRRTQVRTLARQLRRDMDWVVMKCMEKDRTRRYETANGLAEDISRYLNNEPVQAGPPGALYRLTKFVRRNRVPVTAGVGVIAALLAGLITTLHMYGKSQESRLTAEKEKQNAQIMQELAEAERAEAKALFSFLGRMVESVFPAQAFKRDLTVEELFKLWSSQIEVAMRGHPKLEEQLHGIFAQGFRSLGIYDYSLKHLSRGLELAELQKGKNSPAVGEKMLEMASLHLEMNDGETAYQYFEQGNKLTKGQRSRDTNSLEGNRALMLGEYASAEEIFRRDLANWQAVVGPDHPRVAIAWRNLGQTKVRSGALAEGLGYHQQELDIRRRVLRPDDPEIAASLQAIGDVLIQMGRASEAEPLLREAVEISNTKLPKEHIDVIINEATLGECLTALGKYVEAEALLSRCIANVDKIQEQYHRNLYTNAITVALAKLYEAWDVAEPSKGYREKAEHWRERLAESKG